MATIAQAIAESARQLRGAGVETPSLDAALLLAHTLKQSREYLFARGDEPLPQDAARAFRALTARRASGECVAYLTGKKEFYGLMFTVSPDVLVPQPDTETLVDAALAFLKRLETRPPRVLDLGTGSGAVAITLKYRFPGAEVWASDISEKALSAARANADRLLGPGALRFFRADLFQADGDEALPAFDLIVSNPPYVPSGALAALPKEVRCQPALALDGGPSGLRVIEALVRGARARLAPGGGLLVEAAPSQMGAIRALLSEAGFSGTRVWRDLAGRERVAGASRGVTG
ncbi:MAG: peptide chain release factor N(5)-glutamine methyltransferase [Treponema sp.]|nr:peptide chain release factor N(5)-glutamine methyltransferase [Treponema sp.]